MVISTIPEVLGEELYEAAKSNDVTAVQALVKSYSPVRWAEDPWNWVLGAALIGGAVEIAAYSIEKGAKVQELALRTIAVHPKSEPVYRYLIEMSLVDVDDGPEHWGPMVGIAAGRGLHSRAQFLLEHGANPNHRIDWYGRLSTLAAAARHSDDEMVELLLHHGAKVRGSRAVVVAANEGKVSMVLNLLEAGADIDEMTVETGRALGHRVLGTSLHKSVTSGHLEVVAALLDAGADVSLRDGLGRTALSIAREQGSSMEMLKILEHAVHRWKLSQRPSGDPRSRTVRRSNPRRRLIYQVRAFRQVAARSFRDAILDAAVIGGAAQVAAFGLERGAAIDNLVLGNVICSACEPIYRLFVDAGVVKINDEVDQWGFPLGIAAGQGLHSRVQYLLGRGARPDVNVKVYGGMSTLAVAALRSDTEMIDLLVRHGAVVRGSGAITVAAREGKLSMVSSLLEAGADVNELGVRYTDERSVTSMGTPLHKSVQRGHPGIVAALLDAGADISVRNGQGKAVIEIAREKRASNEIVAPLEHALSKSTA